MPQLIRAAGAVLTRCNDRGLVEVAVIHRPHRHDWTLPKGKCDPGEVLPQTAVREVLEETGLRITLGPPLSAQEYVVGESPKRVDYWRANSISGEFLANDEVDELRWLEPTAAKQQLSYAHDRDLVDEALETSRTVPLLLVRHAHAGDREAWLNAGHDDSKRPLSERGELSIAPIAEIARAFGVTRVVTSPALRCTQTVAHLREFAQWQKEVLLQDGADIPTIGFTDLISDLRAHPEPLAVCAHGEQVDWLVTHLGLPEMKFSKGGVLVVHRDAGALDCVVAREWYPAPR